MTTTNPYAILCALEVNQDLLLTMALGARCSESVLILLSRYEILLRQMKEALDAQAKARFEEQFKASVAMLEVKRG
jgi:hypothetical protein